jgi:hypothetical protein
VRRPRKLASRIQWVWASKVTRRRDSILGSWPCIPLTPFNPIRQLSTDCGSNDDGGRNRLDARRTSRMKAPHSSRCRSMDTVDNSYTDNTHIHNPGSHSRTHPAIQTQFRPKPEHQNAAPKQKRIHRPPMQLREVFSSSLFYLHRLVQLRLPSLSSQYFVSKASYLVGMGGVRIQSIRLNLLMQPPPVSLCQIDSPDPLLQCHTATPQKVSMIQRFMIQCLLALVLPDNRVQGDRTTVFAEAIGSLVITTCGGSRGRRIVTKPIDFANTLSRLIK